MNKKLVLESGDEFLGYGFGANTSEVTEVVFNTSMVGYQEILTDPSYTYQSVVMTYPVIGNYGITDDDNETKVPTIGGLIVKVYNDYPSNYRYTKTLGEIMEENNIPGIYGVDTRAITRIIRSKGSQKGIIVDINMPKEMAINLINETEIKKDAVSKVSSKKKWYSKTSNPKFNVVLIDFGVKHNIIRSLNALGCNVTVVPYTVSKEEIESLSPDGIFLSNGPGDPSDVVEGINLVKSLIGKYPICGICLGHQIIALAFGGKTYKLKFGHRGGNHPVKNLKTDKIEITSQNHSYAVDENSLKNTGLVVTHKNLLDNTVSGMENLNKKIFSVQYHPESCPGPNDSRYLFNQFIKLMEDNKNA